MLGSPSLVVHNERSVHLRNRERERERETMVDCVIWSQPLPWQTMVTKKQHIYIACITHTYTPHIDVYIPKVARHVCDDEPNHETQRRLDGGGHEVFRVGRRPEGVVKAKGVHAHPYGEKGRHTVKNEAVGIKGRDALSCKGQGTPRHTTHNTRHTTHNTRHVSDTIERKSTTVMRSRH